MKNLQQNHSVERTGTSRPLISSSHASGGWLPPLTLVVRLTVPRCSVLRMLDATVIIGDRNQASASGKPALVVQGCFPLHQI